MITIKNLGKTYKNNQIGIKNIDINFPTTGLIVISGPSGSGKSTFLNSLSGLENYTTGEIKIDGVSVKNLSKYSTCIFQKVNLIENLTVAENITFSLNLTDVNNKIDKILSKLNILNIKNLSVNKISSSQRQKVAIARALVKGSQVILGDDLTANLNEINARELFSILRLLADDKLIIITTNNEKLALEYTNNVIKMANGEIIENNINEINDITKLTVTKNNSLNTRTTINLAVKNILQNKMKAIFTFALLLLSGFFLAVEISIAAMDLDRITYQAFVNNNQEYVQFYSKVNIYSTDRYSISESTLAQINPDLICYDYVNYDLRYQEKITRFDSVWVCEKDLIFNQSIGDNEVMISSDYADILRIDGSKLIGTDFISANENLKIIGIIPLKLEYTIIMNEKTFLKQNGNLLSYSSIIMKTNTSVEFDTLFNPFIDKSVVITNNNDLVKGMQPQEKNEICLPEQTLKDLFYNVEIDELIGTNITIDIWTGNNYSRPEDNQIFETFEFKLTGISKNNIIFSDADLIYFHNNYGSERINNRPTGAIYINYNLDTFKEGAKLGIFPQGEVRNQVADIYKGITGYREFAISYAIVPLAIALIIFFSSVFTSESKMKKDLDVLISFNIKTRSLSKIFLFENIMIFLSSLIISSFAAVFWVNFTNTKITRQWRLDTPFLRFETILYLVSIMILLTLIVIVVMLALIKLLRRRPIDIISNW